jgi:hypothetical protein
VFICGRGREKKKKKRKREEESRPVYYDFKDSSLLIWGFLLMI